MLWLIEYSVEHKKKIINKRQISLSKRISSFFVQSKPEESNVEYTDN